MSVNPTKFELVPRWPGAPPICIASNMMAFEDVKSAKSFLESNSPHYSISRIWLCQQCGKMHFQSQLSGDDARSGAGIPPDDIPFIGVRTGKVFKSSPESHDLLTNNKPAKIENPSEKPKQDKPLLFPKTKKQEPKKKEGELTLW